MTKGRGNFDNYFTATMVRDFVAFAQIALVVVAKVAKVSFVVQNELLIELLVPNSHIPFFLFGKMYFMWG